MAKSVTARALDLLGAFDAEHRSLKLSDLARRSGTPLATAHRLVAELQKWGALSREPTGEYVIGRRIWQLGLLAPVQSELRTAASPFLHDLYGATLATVHLAVRDGLQVLYLERLPGTCRCRWSARSAPGCRCTPPGSGRCCSPTRRTRCWRPRCNG
jgi:DNA-binding IclR family transcriptional regulator